MSNHEVLLNMKRKLLFLFFLGGLMVTAKAQQLPNYGFNSWKSACASTESFGDYNEMRKRPGVEPTEWNGSSVNQAVKAIVKIEKEQELVYNDNNTVKMVNTFVGAKIFGKQIGSVAPGFINFGTPWVYATSTVSECDGGVYGGIDFCHKPDAITGRYKRTDATGEKSHIIVYLWNGTFTSKVGKKGSPSTNRDNVDKAIMGMVDASAKGTLVASCDYEFTATTNNDWQTITIPLTYAVDASVNPTMMNAIISGGDYWNRDNMKENTTLYADDVRFVYYSTLKSLSYDGKALALPEAGATLDMSSVLYDESKLDYALNGQTATATTSFDDASSILTIKVSNVDNDIDGQSSHTYYIKFAHVHGAFKYVSDGANITVTCGKCNESLGTVGLVLPSDLVYNGKAKEVTLNGLIEGMENPTVVYSSGSAPVNVGTYTATIQLGDATASVEYTIKAKDIAGAKVGTFAPMTYTGKAQTPMATVTIDGMGEVTGTWSSVTAVTDKTTFTASGNYTGTISNVACGMQAKDIAGAKVGAFAPMTYTGKAQTPVATVTIDGMGEVTGTWSSVTAVADKTTFTASGNYTGTISNVACGMQAKDIAGAKVGAFAPMTYTGKAQTPVATVTIDGMGEVTGTWSSVTAVADKTTFTASGNYTGTISDVACGMQAKDIAEAIVGKFAQMTYTGQPQMPEAIVTLEGYGIVSGTWSSVTGVADKTTFTASGNYTGTISDVACGMQAKDIAEAKVGEFAPMTYTGEAQMPAATVTLDGFGEVTGSWSEVLNVGDKTTFTASGNYVGALTVVAQMTPQTVAVVSAKVEDVAFDADGEYTLVVTDVVFDAVELAAGVDYTAEAQLVGENVEGATNEVLITFTMLNANYALAANTLSTTVTLLQHEHEWQYAADGASILATCKDTDSNCPAKVANITLQAPADAVYSGTAKAVTLVGNYPGLAKLQELITYSGDCIDAGRYVANISYEGVEATLEFEILPKDITDEAVVGEFAPMTYTGEPQMPAAAVTLEGYGEITGAWSEVVNVDDVATFTANGNYTGTVSVVTGMSPAELTQPVVEGIVESYEYTGNTIEPKVTVMNGETLLVEDVDYVVTYSDNVEAGVGTVLITFIGNYSGTLTLTFEIIDTAIEDILTDEVKVCYDLYGRRVLEPLKGELYIVNGKKVRW